MSEKFRDVRRDLFRRRHRAEALGHIALAIDQELLEVPRDIGVVGLAAQPLVELAGALAVHLGLGEHRELDAVLGRRELEDLFVSTWLLVTELVARKAKDGKAGGIVFIMKRTQTCVLRREASSTRDVDNEEHLTAEGGEAHLFSSDGPHAEVINV